MKLNLRNFVLPVFAGGMLGFSIYHVVETQKTYPQAQPPIQPPSTPFAHTVAGSGIVEPNSESSTTSTIAIG
jgi:HlyD family secretion protein